MGRKIIAALANDWQISGILTAGSAARYDVTYQYQNNGANVNLTGSPDYAPRVVINGDAGSGCSGDRFSQFNTSVFSGPLPGSLGMESGRNYLVGCADHTLDLAIARSFNVGGGRLIQLRMEMYNALNSVIYNCARDAAAARQPDQPDDSQFAVPAERRRRSRASSHDERGLRRRYRRARRCESMQAQIRFQF